MNEPFVEIEFELNGYIAHINNDNSVANISKINCLSPGELFRYAYFVQELAGYLSGRHGDGTVRKI